jgi:glycerol-3-phosphate acyltransferase PlsY
MECEVSPFPIYVLTIVIGYFAGSISFAVLIARAKGVDIFTIGSGNPGATNVLRALGKVYGFGCFVLDALKGVAAVLIGMGIALKSGMDPQALGIAGLFGAIAGHTFSIFLKFRGGKGVATTAGGLLTLMPPVILVGAVAWLVVFFSTRYVSLASLVLGISLPVSAFIFKMDQLSFGLCIFLAILIVVRHRSNIQRLLSGKETKTGGVKK